MVVHGGGGVANSGSGVSKCQPPSVCALARTDRRVIGDYGERVTNLHRIIGYFTHSLSPHLILSKKGSVITFYYTSRLSRGFGSSGVNISPAGWQYILLAGACPFALFRLDFGMVTTWALARRVAPLSCASDAM